MQRRIDRILSTTAVTMDVHFFEGCQISKQPLRQGPETTSPELSGDFNGQLTRAREGWAKLAQRKQAQLNAAGVDL